MPPSDPPHGTVRRPSRSSLFPHPSFRVEVTDGPDAGLTARSFERTLTIGRQPNCGLRMSDLAVSYFHAELRVAEQGVRVVDFESSNGTFIRGIRIGSAMVESNEEICLGESKIRVFLEDREDPLVTSAAAEFHGLIGGAPVMRALYAKLTAAANTDSTVLLLGECGTGKEVAAQALHAAGERRQQNFEIVHCGGMPSALIESLLFGHVRGSFTGATSNHEGAFVRADKGTIFLDEIGELPLDEQPKLLRVLESGQVQRVGEGPIRQTDVRVIAATNRDLRDDVNKGRFRADLFYRLSVIQVRMPALREHMDDLPAIAEGLTAHLRATRRGLSNATLTPEMIKALFAHSWPGNVRELRNYLEEWFVLHQRPERPGTAPVEQSEGGFRVDIDVPLREAREVFDAAYLASLLKRNHWAISKTADDAGIDRATVFRMARKLGIDRAT